MTATINSLPIPPKLDLEGSPSQQAEDWKDWKVIWDNYRICTELDKKDEAIQVAHMLTYLGPKTTKLFGTLSSGLTDENRKKIAPVIERFDDYFFPKKSVPMERLRFNRRSQREGEAFNSYLTELRRLASTCEFNDLDDMLRDRILFGIRDAKVRERLLRAPDLTLQKTVEICLASEQSLANIKIIDEPSSSASVHVLGGAKKKKEYKPKNSSRGTSSSRNFSGYKTTSQGAVAQTGEKYCKFCGCMHFFGKQYCRAIGKSCNLCGKLDHFRVFHEAKDIKLGTRKQPKVHEVSCSQDDSFGQIFKIGQQSDGKALITLQFQNGEEQQFQIDTGADRSMLPIQIYKRVTGDHTLQNVTRGNSYVRNYGNEKLPILGTSIIRVWKRDGHSVRLECHIIEGDRFKIPLLSKRASEGLKCVVITDQDTNSLVNAVSVVSTPILKKQLVDQFPAVFDDELGRVPGKYHIRLKGEKDPVKHAPRNVPFAIREKVKAALSELETRGVIAKVVEPTPWLSSMLVRPKKNGTLRICLDPKDLNEEIQRENYQLPTVEIIAARLKGAKRFTICDAREGFWHVELDNESSALTTFQTPFGRYRWCRMPFGINSAPEVFQRKMHEHIEGLDGVDVIADDFLVYGIGETQEVADLDHDRNLLAFLQRCQERTLKLNIDKFKLRLTVVRFIGHIFSAQGVSADPEKVNAIINMPDPVDIKSLERFLGMVGYLGKFLPRLSDMTKPLRDLKVKGNNWIWNSEHQTAMNQLKKALAETPVLRFYSLAEDVTLQCDASQHGLGAVLLQDAQPVAYASRAMTSSETKWAQIEKECLAIVWACEKFDDYLFGRPVVHVETDHKPLETIFKKRLDTAPLRLQKLLMRLQRYNLAVKYKKGVDMCLADPLSRAHLPTTEDTLEIHELSSVDQRNSQSISTVGWDELSQASADDPLCAELRDMIINGWPERAKVPLSLHPFFGERSHLIVQDSLIFRGQQVYVPTSLRKKLMALVHSSHMGIAACQRRLREALYWPGSNNEFKDWMTHCDICMKHRDAQQKEPLLPHEIINRPWAKLGVDICQLDDGRQLLVVTDYYSNYPEVDRLSTTTSKAIIRSLSIMFARFGVPDELISDNGPQFSSAEFARFTAEWKINHTTSSPYHPQSNGKAENAVKTIKNLFTKAKEAGISEAQALLDFRNTPTEGIGSSPAQRLMGRRCKTLLVTTPALLAPKFGVKADAKALRTKRDRDRIVYDHHARPLSALKIGSNVSVRLPGMHTWTPGVCTGQHGPRSYWIRVHGRRYRRNRRHIRTWKGSTPTEGPDDVLQDLSDFEMSTAESSVPPPVTGALCLSHATRTQCDSVPCAVRDGTRTPCDSVPCAVRDATSSCLGDGAT